MSQVARGWSAADVIHVCVCSLSLQSLGGVLPSLSINYFDSASFDPSALSKPVVYVMPSMSHSGLVTRSPAGRKAKQGVAGWWEEVVGFGSQFGVDLNKFRVVSSSPLGGPYGTTSPLSVNPLNGKPYRASFPLITPLDQARVHAFLLDHLGVKKVHAIVGASMGGMQVLQFAVHFPERYDRVIAICTTGQTSPSTQALRSVQRAAVRMDPHYANGDYADAPPPQNVGPRAGMGIARMFGTICYRSRAEFDARFSNRPLEQPVQTAAHTTPAYLFEVERYLHHQADTFTGRYDANCYLTLSQCMDLMDLASAAPITSPSATSVIAASASTSPVPPLSYEQACSFVPASKQLMLLPIASDALIPPAEMERLARSVESTGARETMSLIAQ
jgi:homoserine O-acetyltransferase